MFEDEEVSEVQEVAQPDPDEAAAEVVDNPDELVDNPDETDPEADTDPDLDPDADPEAETDPEPEPAALDGAFYDSVRAAFPDAELNTPEAFQEAAATHIQTLEAYRTKSREVNKVLNELYRDHTAYLNLSKDLAAGMPEGVALARNFDLEAILNSTPGDEDHEAIESAKAEFQTQKAEQLARVSEYDTNSKASAAVLTAFAASSKMPEAEATKFFNQIDELLGEVATGKISENFLNIMRKGMDYDKAKETARIAGRNEAIVAKKENRPKGDTVPHITGTGKPPEKPKQELDWASEVILSHT